MPATQTIDAQRLQALQVANATRSLGVEVKRDVRLGELTVSQAVSDPRAQGLRLYQLLGAQKGMGAVRVERVCRLVPCSPSRRVRELTERQRWALLDALDGR